VVTSSVSIVPQTGETHAKTQHSRYGEKGRYVVERVSARRPPELLAPAGGPDAFRAAINNGADAVYLGLGSLNARRGAENFTSQTLADACRYAHIRDSRVYLTANVLVLPDEMAGALELVDQAWVSGIDAVIVQDLGLLRVLRKVMPHVRVHASTQMNAHNTPTVAELGRLGVSRVTLARETSVEEIARFVSDTDVEIESFVHGALCMCYSGQCLLSSLIGARSANRGMCAQPCRLAYDLIDKSGRALATQGGHLLSPKDLAGITLLPQLVHAGVAALKIEGRMKSPEYVALVTGVYREALDRAVASADAFVVRDGEQRVLEEAFSRGFTQSYLLGERGNAMMSYRRPNNRGVSIGRVAAVSGDTATIALETQVEAEDTIEFWTGRGRFAQRVGELEYASALHASAPAGTRATVRVRETVRAGDRVFRVANASLLAAARRTFSAKASGPPVPLVFKVRLLLGQPLRIEVCDASGRCGHAEGPVVDKARTKSVTVEDVMEHVGRLGSTPFTAASWDVELSPGVGLGFSQLHAVRREALDSYENRILHRWTIRKRSHPRLPRSDARSSRRSTSARRHARSLLAAAFEDPARAPLAMRAGADEAHVPVYALGHHGSVEPGFTPVLPRILHDRETARATRFLEEGGRVVVANLGMARTARDAGARVEAHWALNTMNPWTAAALADIGADLIWLSPELSGRQIATIADGTQVTLGVAVYGRQEVMVTEHCILMSEGECHQQCATCPRRAEVRFLKDKKGYRFPVVTDPTGRSHLYNAVPLDLVGSIPELLEAGVRAFRLDFTIESGDEVERVTEQVRRVLDTAQTGDVSAEPVVQPATTGHYFRGVR